VIALAALAGCSIESKPDRKLSERERDSIIAQQPLLPGSRVVGRALKESDKATARAQELEKQAAPPPEDSQNP
jgi:hypothetical protein